MVHRCSHMGPDSYHNSEICVELDNLFQLFKSTSFVSINANGILPTQATSREQSLCEFHADSAWSAESTNNKSSVPMDPQDGGIKSVTIQCTMLPGCFRVLVISSSIESRNKSNQITFIVK